MNPSPSPSPSHRFWIPGTICTVAFLIFVAVQAQPELERNIKSWITGALLILMVALNFLWLIFLSRFPGVAACSPPSW